eukprot:jgi/Undpi1/10884/HiC_scaffold_3.g01410.m1
MRDGGAALLVSSRHAARLLFLCAALPGALASGTVEAGRVTSAWSPPQAVISDLPPVVFGARFTPTGRSNVAEGGDTMAAVGDRVAAVGDIVAVGGDAVAEGGDNVAVGGDNVAAGDENVAAAAKGEIPPGVDNVAVGGDNLPRRGDNGAPATSEIATGALRKEGTKKQAPRHRKKEGKGSSEEDGTAARVAIMIACAVGAVLICCAWCWLNAMLIIIAWCIEKYRKRRELQLGAAKVDDGGEDGKVVHATMCGTLASVVCTSDVTSSAPTRDKTEPGKKSFGAAVAVTTTAAAAAAAVAAAVEVEVVVVAVVVVVVVAVVTVVAVLAVMTVAVVVLMLVLVVLVLVLVLVLVVLVVVFVAAVAAAAAAMAGAVVVAGAPEKTTPPLLHQAGFDVL